MDCRWAKVEIGKLVVLGKVCDMSRGRNGQWLDLACMLKIELTRFGKGLAVWAEEMRSQG